MTWESIKALTSPITHNTAKEEAMLHILDPGGHSSDWNPLTIPADGLRGAFYFHRAPDLWTTILPLAVLGALLFGGAGAAMAKAAEAQAL